jgi:hypothetical protein
VVVSSETPRQSLATSCQRVGYSAWTFLSRSLMTSSSWNRRGVNPVVAVLELKPLWMSRVTSPPSSTTSCGPRRPLPPGKLRAWLVHHQYSSRVSPFQAKTGTPAAAMAAAAWSWVEKMLQLPSGHRRRGRPGSR